jgi:hypothetical protein
MEETAMIGDLPRKERPWKIILAWAGVLILTAWAIWHTFTSSLEMMRR